MPKMTLQDAFAPLGGALDYSDEEIVPDFYTKLGTPFELYPDVFGEWEARIVERDGEFVGVLVIALFVPDGEVLPLETFASGFESEEEPEPVPIAGRRVAAYVETDLGPFLIYFDGEFAAYVLGDDRADMEPVLDAIARASIVEVDLGALFGPLPDGFELRPAPAEERNRLQRLFEQGPSAATYRESLVLDLTRSEEPLARVVAVGYRRPLAPEEQAGIAGGLTGAGVEPAVVAGKEVDIVELGDEVFVIFAEPDFAVMILSEDREDGMTAAEAVLAQF